MLHPTTVAALNALAISGGHYVAEKYHLSGRAYPKGEARFYGAGASARAAFNRAQVNPTKGLTPVRG